MAYAGLPESLIVLHYTYSCCISSVSSWFYRWQTGKSKHKKWQILIYAWLSIYIEMTKSFIETLYVYDFAISYVLIHTSLLVCY